MDLVSQLKLVTCVVILLASRKDDVWVTLQLRPEKACGTRASDENVDKEVDELDFNYEAVDTGHSKVLMNAVQTCNLKLRIQALFTPTFLQQQLKGLQGVVGHKSST